MHPEVYASMDIVILALLMSLNSSSLIIKIEKFLHLHPKLIIPSLPSLHISFLMRKHQAEMANTQ